MKKIKYILVLTLSISFLGLNGQEKKIKFSKGTLKICSSKNFTITGYDGNEVIIKSLHEKRGSNSAFVVRGYNKNSFPLDVEIWSRETIFRRQSGKFHVSYSRSYILYEKILMYK